VILGRTAYNLTMRFALSILAIQICAASLPALGDDKPYIPVGVAKTRKSVIAYPDAKLRGPLSGDLSAHGAKVHQIVEADLGFMDLFRLLDSSAFIEKSAAGITIDSFKLSDWSSIGTEFLIKTALSREGTTLTLETFLYEVATGKTILAKRYVAPQSETHVLAHSLANDIVQALTGQPGVFMTKIAMSCDRGTKQKEIYIMDFDGTDLKQVTRHRSIAMAPAWSPDGRKLAYSLFAQRRSRVINNDLYEFDFGTNAFRRLSDRTGINSGAAYSPDGSKIALTMSFLGNPEVFLYDRLTAQVSRLTKNTFAMDVDPTWSPDGRQMAYVSNESGRPMVYRMNADGGGKQRLTFAGVYNATPTWAPNGKKIGFAGWIDRHFDIFVMNPDGTHIERLTKDQGNNEDPHFSPDGNFLVFSSNRTGQANVYVMNIDGTFVKRLTYGMGNCVSPKWSNPVPTARAQ